MIRTITAHNINHAFTAGWWALKTSGVEEQSRNGPVLVMPAPVVTTYLNPRERVLFHPERDANPFFHLMESVWMLAGDDRIEWLSQFSSNIKNYAEDDGFMYGAYGYRWRNLFGTDQLAVLIDKLKNNPSDRRAVLAMWRPESDLGQNFRDHPCNTHIYFRVNQGKLDMTVCNRSNDMLWGAYGANVVHMSFLQEFMAQAIGIPVGVYHQMSNNFHVYTDNPMVKKFLDLPPGVIDHYGEVQPYPLLDPTDNETWRMFLDDCESFIQGAPIATMKCRFLNRVAGPMRDYYLSRKAGAPDDTLIKWMPDCDWKLAAQQWIARREK